MKPASRFLPLLLVFFAASGCAALMFGTVWYQLALLAIGSTARSMALLFAASLAGFCIGNLRLSKFRSDLHPLKLFAYLQVGVAICGVLVPLMLRIFGSFYFAAILCALPPAILIGASLPAAARWINATRVGASWWGMLYGAAAIGAALGYVITGFLILRFFDQNLATIIAAVITLAVAASAWWLSSRVSPHVEILQDDAVSDAEPDFSPATILWTTALSGAAALGAAIVWTRLLAIQMGSTTYVYSIILAIFLVAMGTGGIAGAWIGRNVTPRFALGGCHILMPLAMAWASFAISDSLPYWPVNPFLAANPWLTFQIDAARVMWTLLPPALLWGASLTLALAALGTLKNDATRSVGSVYAANAAGALVGALAITLAVVPAMGTENAERLAILLAAAGALTALGPQVRRYNANALGAALSGSLMLAIWLATQVDALPGESIAYGRQISTMLGQSQVVYAEEGANSSVAISKWPAGQIYLNVNGHVEATTESYDMALQRMLGHLPGILHPNPKSVLVLGFGAGVSAGTFTLYPSIEHITICEVEPVLPPISTKYLAKQNYQVEQNPKTKIVYDDPRHCLLTASQKFDIITTDPLDVFAKGSAARYSTEYFETVKAHLNPGGFFTLYMPLYETDESSVQSELATFFAVFPNATVWANTRDGQGYDTVLLGQAEPLKINIDEVQARLDRDDYRLVRESLLEIGFPNAASLFKRYTGRQRDLGRWFAGAEVTTDRDLRLMYQAGWAMNSYIADSIYRQMLRYRQVPRDMFTGDQDTIEDILSESSGVPKTPGTTQLPAPTSNEGQPPR